jgi:hypothetical protein
MVEVYEDFGKLVSAAPGGHDRVRSRPSALVSSGMSSTVTVVVKVIGWSPHPREPRALQPQFVNPVRVRIYTPTGVRASCAYVRLDGSRVLATVLLADQSPTATMRCFCIAEREYEPVTHIERRRITSLDLCLL